jgi:hypothetical protein
LVLELVQLDQSELAEILERLVALSS